MDEKQKKTAINPKNKEDNCFQYAITVALNHEQIKRHLQRITKALPCFEKPRIAMLTTIV